MTDPTLIVLAKEPRPGLAKTRLTPPCTPDQAASIAEAALRDTLDVVAGTPARRRILALEGDWPSNGLDVVPQPTGGLDERIGAALECAGGPAGGPVVLIGMDTPQVTPDLLLACDFDQAPAWLGPADDGGYWLIGLAEPRAELIHGVPMSTPYTYAVQHGRLTAAGLTVGRLPMLRDVDTWPDAIEVAATAPGTRFAELVRSVPCPI